MAKLKKKKIVLLVVLAVVAVVAIGAISFLMMGQGTVRNMEIKDVSAQGVADGTYTGQFDGYRWTNTLEVTVLSGEITGIEILQDQAAAVPDVSSKLFARVIEKQSPGVDVVSGATVSSKAYLKAVENALLGAQEGGS